MRIGCLIPTIRPDLCDGLLDSISRQAEVPEKLVVVDNTAQGYAPERALAMRVLRPDAPLGVNASWRAGLAILAAAGMEAVAVLNDDLVLGRDYFQAMRTVLTMYPDAGVACPATVHDPEELAAGGPRPGGIHDMRRREGWAFCIRTRALADVPPIPDELDTFCGDDWIWHHTRRAGWRWLKTVSCLVYHMVGASVSARPEIRARLAGEKRAFARLIGGAA